VDRAGSEFGPMANLNIGCFDPIGSATIPCLSQIQSSTENHHGLQIQTRNSHHISLSVVVVRKRTIPTERPPLVGEVSANLCG
jgi:hypothetical protein